MAVSNSPLPVKTQTGKPLESDIQKINGVDVPGSSGYMPSDITAVNGAATTNGLPIDDTTPIEFDVKLVNGAATTNGLPIDDTTPIEFDIKLVNGAATTNGLPIDDTTPIDVNIASEAPSGTMATKHTVGTISDGATQAGTPNYVALSVTFAGGTTATLRLVRVSFGRGAQAILYENDGLGARTALMGWNLNQGAGSVEHTTLAAEHAITGDANGPFWEIGYLNTDKNDGDDATNYGVWTTV